MEKAWLQKDFSGFELTNYVLTNLKKYNLTLGEGLILLYLTSFYNAHRRLINPKISTIAENVLCSERTVLRAMKKMCECGYIQKFKTGKNSSYVITSSILVNGETIRDKMSPEENNRCQNVTYICDKMSPEENLAKSVNESENNQKNAGEQNTHNRVYEEDKSSSLQNGSFARAKSWGVFENLVGSIQEEDLELLLDFVESKKVEKKGAYLVKILKTNYKEVLAELKNKKEAKNQMQQIIENEKTGLKEARENPIKLVSEMDYNEALYEYKHVKRLAPMVFARSKRAKQIIERFPEIINDCKDDF